MSIALESAPSSVAPAAPAAPPTPAVESAAQNGTAAVATPAPTAGASSTPAPDPRAELAALSEEFGTDLSTFPDAAAARAALRWQAEQAAHAGLDALAGFRAPAMAPAPAPPSPPTTPAYTPVDLAALGLDESEPAAKAIRALEKQLDGGGAPAAALVARLEAVEAQHRVAAQRELRSQADAFVDGLQSAQYGTSKARTPAQRLALAQLYDTADAILYGDVKLGRPAPTVGNRLARARMILDSASASAATGAAVPTPAPAVPAPVAPGLAPIGGAVNVPMNARWADDPAMRAQLGLG